VFLLKKFIYFMDFFIFYLYRYKVNCYIYLGFCVFITDIMLTNPLNADIFMTWETVMGLSEKIKILLIKAGKTQTALANEALGGMSKTYFNNKLKDEKFTREELEKIAEYLGATYNEDPPPRQWFTLKKTGEEI